MVDTRSRRDTLLERFEELDAIWPDRVAYERLGTSSLPTDDILSVEAPLLGGFLRRHAWGLIALVTVIAAASWMVWVAAPALDERLAAETLDSYDGALLAVDAAVPDARRALLTLTDATSDTAELSASLEGMAPFISAADATREAVAKPLPETPPLVPRVHIEALAPIRLEMAGVADHAETLATRLGSLLTYRLLADDLFVFGALPTVADTDAIDELSVALASSLAASVEAIVSLPSDPLLADHREAANAALTLLERLRGDYLAALRAEDEPTAAALVGEMEAALRSLDTTLQESLSVIATWGSRDLDLLRVATIEARQLTAG